MSSRKEKEQGKKFTLGSRIAIVGSLIMFFVSPVGIWFAPRPGVVQEPQPLFFLPLALFVSSSLVTMICAISVNYAPSKLKVALGAIIVVSSIIPAIFLFALFPLLVGNVLALIGGLLIIAEKEETKEETKKPSKEKLEELSEKEYEKLTKEEKHVKEEYEQLMEED